MARLTLSRIDKSFVVANLRREQRFHIFQNFSIDIADRQFVSVVGPSGCGKSTLLNLVAGIEACTAGSIAVDGEPVRGPGLDRGIVFQQFALFPWLTARDNIEFGLRSKGLGAAERRRISDEHLALVGLGDFADYFPNRLSGGMKQRVGIGRALAIDPKVLLMDEPFGALDALTRETMQNTLAEIWERRHKTVLFITHDIREAVFLSDRVVVLNGRPARAVLDVAIDLPRPRDRHGEAFGKYEDLLQDAVREVH
ncbi:ABC transporter ATP-binding protein [Propylenella binzhouense]|uniref:ABC transporter ATP-binding protein n=1 Tax=Propylenella binzhouense TaxID=2555902 RepID=A0A964T4N1_9HYPH|nr:ABC transporter ATP-binding protein [Propylenella binzhouense]MYZ48315.1 ABC transporter ATP-binding protein [Propylenella binzhouense]